MFEHVGILSFHIISQVEMDGAACLWDEKVSLQMNAELGLGVGVLFRE